MKEKNKFNKDYVKKQIISKPLKLKLVKKKYTLITNVSINGVIKKKGSTIELTEEGKQYFKQQFYI